MNSKHGFWLLLVGVLMIAIAKGYSVYTDKSLTPSFTGTWNIWTTLGVMLATAGLALSYKKLSAGLL